MRADKWREAMRIRGCCCCVQTWPGPCAHVNEDCKAARMLSAVQGEPGSTFNLQLQLNKGFISSKIIQAEALLSLPPVQVEPPPTLMHSREINSRDGV